MMRIFLLLPWLFQATAANQRDFTARLVATDVRFMRGSHLEADDSPTLPAYERQVRHNIRYLKDRGVTVEEGWNLLQAYDMWNARIGLPHPSVILLVGVLNSILEV